ncbi:MAG: AraC family transcriptional regulator [Verrucomicrobiae bacterium]|nr:AraC family transcriptional regulator [Verrucomicrobiae bacterium]
MRLILHAGLKQQPSGYRFATYDYDQLQVIVVQNGELAVELEGDPIRRARRGMVLLLRPGSRFRLACPRRGYDGVFAVARAAEERPGPSRLLPAGRSLAVVAGEMRHAIESGAAAHPGLLHAFAALILRLAEAAGDASLPASEPWADRVGRLLNFHLYSSTPVAEILRGLPLGARQIHRHYKAATGKGVKRDLLERKIAEAKRLLANPTISVTAVAMELGFPSSQHFATCFRAITGTTPTAFQKKR